MRYFFVFLAGMSAVIAAILLPFHLFHNASNPPVRNVPWYKPEAEEAIDAAAEILREARDA